MDPQIRQQISSHLMIAVLEKQPLSDLFPGHFLMHNFSPDYCKYSVGIW